MDKFIKFFSMMVLIVSYMVLFSFVMSIPVMYLWNWLIPSLFGLVKITFIRSWGLLMLCSILFKGGNYNPKQ